MTQFYILSWRIHTHLGGRSKLFVSLYFLIWRWRAICLRLGCAKMISYKNVKLLNCLDWVCLWKSRGENVDAFKNMICFIWNVTFHKVTSWYLLSKKGDCSARQESRVRSWLQLGRLSHLIRQLILDKKIKRPFSPRLPCWFSLFMFPF